MEGHVSIQPDQLRKLIDDVLKDIDMHSPAATELLMLTSAQESFCGKYLYQLANGPARGIFQMEPDTQKWLVYTYLPRHPELLKKLDDYSAGTPFNLVANIPYQIVLARLNYYWRPEVLPGAEDIKGLARYYKKYWNTEQGKATVAEAINNYQKYGGVY